MKGTRFIDGILVAQEQLENTERYKTEAIKERFGAIFNYGIVHTDGVSQPLSVSCISPFLVTSISPGEAYTDFDRTEPSPQYGAYGERIYVKEALTLTLKQNGGNRHLFVFYLEVHKNRKLDESNVAFFTEKNDSYIIAQLSDSELSGLITSGSVFATDCYISASVQTDLTSLTTDELNDTFLGSSNYIKVGGVLNRVHLTVTSTNSLYLGTINNAGSVSTSYGGTTRQTFLINSNVLSLPGGLTVNRITTADTNGVLISHTDSAVNSTNMSALVNGAVTTLHKHNLAEGATDITASTVELNKLDGFLGSTSELNNLRSGANADALHSHNISGGTPGAHTHAGGDITSAVATATNADTVDGIHAATTATANTLLALDSNAKLPADITGNAATATGATNASLVSVTDAGSDTTTWPLLGTSQTGFQTPTTDTGLTYNASTNTLTTTFFAGALNGNASTVTNGVYTNSANYVDLTDGGQTSLHSHAGLGAWTTISTDTVYQAATDGFVVARIWDDTPSGTYTVLGKTDPFPTNPPTTIRIASSGGGTSTHASICMPVKKNDFYKVETTGITGGDTAYYFISLGS